MAHGVTEIQTNNDPRRALADRLWRAAERQASEIETRLAQGPRPPAEAEKDARVLAVLAKTLKELSTIDHHEERLPPEDDDAIPGELDALRSALDLKLREIRAQRLATGATTAGGGAGT